MPFCIVHISLTFITLVCKYASVCFIVESMSCEKLKCHLGYLRDIIFILRLNTYSVPFIEL